MSHRKIENNNFNSYSATLKQGSCCSWWCTAILEIKWLIQKKAYYWWLCGKNTPKKLRKDIQSYYSTFVTYDTINLWSFGKEDKSRFYNYWTIKIESEDMWWMMESNQFWFETMWGSCKRIIVVFGCYYW